MYIYIYGIYRYMPYVYIYIWILSYLQYAVNNIYIYKCTHMLHEWDMCQNSHPKSASHVGTSTIRRAMYIILYIRIYLVYIYIYTHIRQTKL